MMRKVICFMMVMLLSLSLACPALAAVSSPSNTAPSSSPKTGDQIMMYVVVMVIALVALVAVTLCSRKVFKK